MDQERRLDKYMENTQSRNSEIVTNIKTVKAFATEALELKRQRQRLKRELKVVLFRIHLLCQSSYFANDHYSVLCLWC